MTTNQKKKKKKKEVESKHKQGISAFNEGDKFLNLNNFEKSFFMTMLKNLLLCW